MATPEQIGRRVALTSIFASGALAALKITVGLMARSAAVVSDGVESGADVLASGIVLLGLVYCGEAPGCGTSVRPRPVETLAGLAVGLMLGMTGAGICFGAAQRFHSSTVPAMFALWPLAISMLVKSASQHHEIPVCPPDQ